MDKVSAGALIIFGALVGVMLGASFAATFLDQFMPQAIATLAGVLVGGGLTVWIEHGKAAKTENERRAAAVNVAMLTLAHIQMEIAVFLKSVLHNGKDPISIDDTAAWFVFAPRDLRNLPPPTFDYRELQFLFTSENREILSKLSNLEATYASLIALVRERTHTFRYEILPALDRLGAGETFKLTVVPQALGLRTAELVKLNSQVILKLAAETRDRVGHVATGLRVAAQPVVGDQKIMQFKTWAEFSEEEKKNLGQVNAGSPKDLKSEK